MSPEPLGTRGHVPLHFGKWLGTGGTEGASLETSHASMKHFLIKSGVWQGCCWWCQLHQPECSFFSALCRLKTYLRATIGQPRLNSLLILHCHQDRADKLNLKAISQEFVRACDQRSNFWKLRGIGLSCNHNFVATSIYPADYFVWSWLVVDSSWTYVILLNLP